MFKNTGLGASLVSVGKPKERKGTQEVISGFQFWLRDHCSRSITRRFTLICNIARGVTADKPRPGGNDLTVTEGKESILKRCPLKYVYC